MELQSIRQVLLWLTQEKIALPFAVGGSNDPKIEWRTPSYTTLNHMLTNPVYAGAYPAASVSWYHLPLPSPFRVWAGKGGLAATLFIDEGFGSLDAGSLDLAIDALESLQSQGRQVGVISHVEAMKERIPARVAVHKQGGGKSAIEVCAG